MKLVLSPKFKDFLTTRTRRDYLEGTTAAGKTTVGIFKFMMMVADSDLKFHVIAGADLGTVEKNVINSELGLIAQMEGLAEYYPKGQKKISLPHIKYRTRKGTKIIYVCGFDNKARWKKVLGSQSGCVYIDEVNTADMEFLREIAHLRPRTNTFGAVFRIRHNMAIAIHKFFHEKGFFYFHTPIITASDCEGAGQMFQVTTMNLYDLKKDENGSIVYDDDFFGKQASLTVSGQLEGELAATALGAIYTFGPTFRAENSNTPRHLAEFWMIEPEVAFNEIQENMDLAEEFIKYCVRWALDNCADDVKFLNDMFDKGLIERLEGVLKEDFVRLPYTEGIKILEEAVAKGHKFEFPVYWGVDLASEHERYLVEDHFKRPVILTDYPKEIKAFYMKQNEDGKTVRAMDVLFPKIGEIIGGSERESDYNKLMTRIEEMHIPMKDMWWYLDTRKFGTCPHSGFGLGFERLLLFVTGMSNIRDVIPFPRTPRNADF